MRSLCNPGHWPADTAIFSRVSIHTQTPMPVTPGKQDLQHGMEMGQRGLARYQHPTSDERTDTAQDGSQLIDAETWR